MPAVDALGQLRLKGPVFAGKRFDEVALAAPMYFEAVIKSSQYNQNVSERGGGGGPQTPATKPETFPFVDERDL